MDWVCNKQFLDFTGNIVVEYVAATSLSPARNISPNLLLLTEDYQWKLGRILEGSDNKLTLDMVAHVCNPALGRLRQEGLLEVQGQPG